MAAANLAANWFKETTNIGGFLLDIYGVLYETDAAITGSVEAIQKLKACGIPVRFCTNTTSCTVADFAVKLRGMGFDIPVSELFPPAPATCKVLKQRGLRPFLLIDKAIHTDFAGLDQSDPNCVVLGDATDGFSYKNMTEAFRLLMRVENPTLIAMGKGKYYSDTSGPMLDVGPYMKALEYACDIEAEVIGKPSRTFFMTAVEDMGLTPDQVVMIGDDILYDIGGAQECGMRAIQVRTGKYRPSDEPHPTVKPDLYVDNLLQAVELYLKSRQ